MACSCTTFQLTQQRNSDLIRGLSVQFPPWGPFPESPTKFRAFLGYHKSLCVLWMQRFSIIKLHNHFASGYLQNMPKDHVIKTSGLQFCKWLYVFGTFLIMASGARFSKVPKTFPARKAICEIANRLFWKADLLTCFQGNKMKINCEVWQIKCSPFLSYKGNCDTRKWPVKFRDFRETAPWSEFSFVLTWLISITKANGQIYGLHGNERSTLNYTQRAVTVTPTKTNFNAKGLKRTRIVIVCYGVTLWFIENWTKLKMHRIFTNY